MNEYAYAHEKLSAAMRLMVSSPDPIQQRLRDAYVYELIHVPEDGVPEQLRPQVASLAKVLPRALALTQDEATGTAQEICSLGAAVEDAYFGRFNGKIGLQVEYAG